MYTRILDASTGAINDHGIRRDSDGAIIPADGASPAWQAYEAWQAAGNEPAPAAVASAEPPMRDLTDRQFGEGLWRDGVISYDAYLAFVGPGTLPPLFDEIIDELPDVDDRNAVTPRKVARGLVAGGQKYEFTNGFVPIFQAAMERRDPAWTMAHLRERWRDYAKL